MEKDFFDVFPSLKVKKELEELLDMVFVTRVSCNPSRTHIWVYIKSERWHQNILTSCRRTPISLRRSMKRSESIMMP